MRPTAIHPLLDTPRLHPGEREAISLAFEINASRILMDERAGRALATNLGIPCIGLLGILIQAKRLCLIPSIMPLLDRLQNEARFWIAPSLRLQILHLADETH
jgi:predicted nucleic acid-binding protein